uniref:ribosome biogenesis factor YjgA n=1 Tax=Ningiella ruwaisensis TaxID=2364274 RepID=UPI00109FF218|nr:ribosome biogenesis factor YjgA [Ningiella ruwaisensis]
MNNDPFESDNELSCEYESTEFGSKTQLKQASDALKKLGLELVNLTQGERQKLKLDDELEDAIEIATRINRKKDGFRRQTQLIGKLLRKRDVAPIEQALEKLKNAHTADVRAFHEVELTRDKLIKQGDEGIQALIEEYPSLERQKLRQLLRTIKKEQDENKAPAAYRSLFKYLRENIL